MQVAPTRSDLLVDGRRRHLEVDRAVPLEELLDRRVVADRWFEPIGQEGDDGTVLCGATRFRILDDLPRTRLDESTAWPGRRPPGVSLSLDPGSTSAAANDAPTAWCDASTVYDVSDRGTPGLANDPC